jgi:hypothetical protein
MNNLISTIFFLQNLISTIDNIWKMLNGAPDTSKIYKKGNFILELVHSIHWICKKLPYQH